MMNLKRSPTDYVKGINSKIPFIANVPTGDWRPFVSDNQEQMLAYDTDGCSQLSPAKVAMEGQLNRLLANGKFSAEALAFFAPCIENGMFYISYQFNAILDGTSINGNNPLMTAASYKVNGIIPRSMLNMSLAQSQKYSSQEEQDTAFYAGSNITPAMLAYGKQSLKYISTAYQWINEDNGQNTSIQEISAAAPLAPLIFAVPVPSDVEDWNTGMVVWDGNKELDHCVGNTFIDLTVNAPFPFYIEDNYNPFQKQLSKDYWIPQVIQIVVTAVGAAAVVAPQSVEIGQSSIATNLFLWVVNLLRQNGWLNVPVSGTLDPLAGNFIQGMNQKLLAVLRVIGYTVLFGGITALLGFLDHSTFLNGTVALIATAYGAGLEHDLAVHLGYNFTPQQSAAIKGQIA